MSTSNSASTTSVAPIVNPYSHAATQLRAKQMLVTYGESSQASQAKNLAAAATMGIRSQNCEGSVKKCKKRGTRVKHKIVQQFAINAGGVAFNSSEHCPTRA